MLPVTELARDERFNHMSVEEVIFDPRNASPSARINTLAPTYENASENARSLMHFLSLRTQSVLAKVPSFPQAERVDAAIGAPQLPLLWFDGSAAAPQAIACLSKAAKINAACGVPLARFPSSSSTKRYVENQFPIPQPLVVPVGSGPVAELSMRVTLTATEGPNVGQVFAFEHPHAGCRRSWLQRGGVQILPARVDLVGELHGFRTQSLQLGLAQIG
jgi:hypothetical protein